MLGNPLIIPKERHQLNLCLVYFNWTLSFSDFKESLNIGL